MRNHAANLLARAAGLLRAATTASAAPISRTVPMTRVAAGYSVSGLPSGQSPGGRTTVTTSHPLQASAAPSRQATMAHHSASQPGPDGGSCGVDGRRGPARPLPSGGPSPWRRPVPEG